MNRGKFDSPEINCLEYSVLIRSYELHLREIS